ncbi:MAG: sodium-dependent transporter [Candidatus Goldbacteria bacterium]|nr:sodium-dependent transporter [Candidatus Goldiibacteriota bacterium]
MTKDKKESKVRQEWGSRLGVILAVAGSAVGLGNFLRFPVQAAQNGGGAFMIPYFIALLLVGIPLMWIEWTIGRYGGGFGHGTAPGIFHSMHQKNRFIKYFGVIGMFGPIAIFLYYCYIESWLLGYIFYSITPTYIQALKAGKIADFFGNYINVTSILSPAYIFFIITFVLNFVILYYGIRGGIERVSRIAMPVLLLLGIIMVLRVLTLGFTPDTQTPYKVVDGLGFLWNPDFNALKDMKVWLAAAGQVFFTLSVGMGVIITYASYLKKENDVVLSGLTSAATNEFVEVIIGGSIVIPAAFAFFGPEKMVEIAKGGAFSLGFITMPMILEKIPLTVVFSFLWFLLLFLAGITSSISMLQPAIAFFEDEFNTSRKKAVFIIGVVTFILMQPAIFFIGKGVVDELDFWGGTFALVLFATFEVIMFAWVFGIDKAWDEVHKGAQMEVPKIYKFILKYITPLFLIFILVGWFIQQGIPFIMMKGVDAANKPFIIGTRIGLLVLLLVLVIMVKMAWRKYKNKDIR